MKPYEVARLDELERVLAEGLEWRPIRRRFTSEHAGNLVIEEHRESSGHEELYLVVTGRARFTLDGQTLDAPAGTIVFIREGDVKRVAHSEEPGTTVLAVGGWAKRAFEPSRWELFFAAYGRAGEGDVEGGLELMREGLAERPDDPVLLYHLACLQARADQPDDALASIRRAVDLQPELADRVRKDDDLIEIREEL